MVDAKSHDFSILSIGEDAIVACYEGMGFEAWRQMSKRVSLSSGQYELDLASGIVSLIAAANLTASPSAADRVERDLRMHES